MASLAWVVGGVVGDGLRAIDNTNSFYVGRGESYALQYYARRRAASHRPSSQTQTQAQAREIELRATRSYI